jgi:hypothetical protein
MAKRVIYERVVPIVGRSRTKEVTDEAIAKGNQIAVIKPQRQLGASWMSDLVAKRSDVSLCEECSRRYAKWHFRYDYDTTWKRIISDCDGCGGFLYCILFRPSERGNSLLGSKG